MLCPICLAGLAALVPLAAQGAEPGDAPSDAELDARIRANRTGTIVVHTRPGAAVRVEQLRHAFWFGTAVSAHMWSDGADPEQREQYLRILRDNFNSAVHENALKWYSTERERGKVDYSAADRALQWCASKGIHMRGHCLFWAVPKFVQSWLKELGDDELRAAVEARAAEVPEHYRRGIAEYDVNNEMLHGSFYADRLGPEIRLRMFELAHEANPRARLFLNDYSIMSGDDLEGYCEQIQWFLDHDAPLGGIGCQGHFGPHLDMAHVQRVLDRLAEFGLPIRVTEFDINTDDEDSKAEQLRRFYRICFAHPAVDGILMWGFWRGRHWRPDAALWDTDFTPLPAADAYRQLVYGDWWTSWEGEAGPDGTCELPAFFGIHTVEAGGSRVHLELGAEDSRLEVTIGAD